MNEPLYQIRIRDKLTAAFRPILLEIKDESARHAGHAGHDAKGETHFAVRIISAAFAGHNQVARHRMIYQALADELRERIHAISLKTLTPEEDNLK